MERLPSIPRAGKDDLAADVVHARRALAERAAGRPLPFLAGQAAPLAGARGRIENAIGFAQVPVGLAGPLLLSSSRGERWVYVPMATTEGALVASHSRGMRVLSDAGGARTRVLREGLTQRPVLVYGSSAEAEAAADVARSLREEFAKLTGQGTQHGRLVSAEPALVGRRLVLELVFTTGDAIGINMAAGAADRCMRYLGERTHAAACYVHGEDVEKRANARALHEGRGRSAVAECVVPRDRLQEFLRVMPEDLVSIQRTYQVGFARMGTQNGLVQAANGLASVFLACGQDVAYVTECATGFLDFEVTRSGDLYAAAFLPSLLVGTVGGGSGQGTAAECLDVLGVRGDNGANLFAEILAATVLAGDLSLLASFATHEFVAAHERLGRNRP